MAVAKVPQQSPLTPAACLAGKSRLKIRQPNVIRPSIAADRSPVPAMIIREINQEAAHICGTHFGFFAGGWLGLACPMIMPMAGKVKSQGVVLDRLFAKSVLSHARLQSHPGYRFNVYKAGF
jgi:hypothetical protein